MFDALISAARPAMCYSVRQSNPHLLGKTMLKVPDHPERPDMPLILFRNIPSERATDLPAKYPRNYQKRRRHCKLDTYDSKVVP